MLGRAAYDDPFMLSDIDSEIYSNTKVEISRKDLLTEYLDYVHVMTKKGYDPKIMLKHVFGLKKGEKDAKRFRVKVAEIMNSSSLVENKDELLSMVSSSPNISSISSRNSSSSVEPLLISYSLDCI